MKTYNMVKKYGSYVLASAASMVVSVPSYAAINAADLTAITTGVTADVATVATWAFGILALVLGTTIGFGLVKKFGSKSAT